jgi:hypothetical protein
MNTKTTIGSALGAITFTTSDVPAPIGLPVSTSRVSRLFDQLTLEQAQNIVNSRRDDNAEINLDYLRGDHWRNGEGWVGPRISSYNDPGTSQLSLAAIKKAFVSRNTIAEVTRRQVGGVLGRDLHWKFTVKRELEETEKTDPVTRITKMVKEQPSAAEEALINEAEAALVNWWDKRSVKDALEMMDASALNTKRGVLRLYVPPDLRDDGGNLPPGDLETCLGYIWLQHLGTNEDSLELEFASGTVYTEKRSRRQLGVFTYNEALDLVSQEQGSQSNSEDERAELTYLDDAGNTVIRVIDDEGDVEPPMVMPLGGRLTIFEMNRTWLITPQVISLQKMLNLSLTMKQRNSVQAGFLERIFFNVDWPSEKRVVDGKETWVRKPMEIGPGVATEFKGLEIRNDDNDVTGHATPSVVYRDPVSPATFIETEESAYKSILQEVQQLHYLIAGDAVVSGESRKQARDSYTQDLKLSASKVQEAARWLLETVLAEASFFAGRAGEFEGLRAYVEAHIDSGPIGPDDMRVAREMRDGDLWSEERAMSETGVEDVDAEKARIAKERAQRSELDQKNMAAAQQFMAENAPPTGNLANNQPNNQGGANA